MYRICSHMQAFESTCAAGSADRSEGEMARLEGFHLAEKSQQVLPFDKLRLMILTSYVPQRVQVPYY